MLNCSFHIFIVICYLFLILSLHDSSIYFLHYAFHQAIKKMCDDVKTVITVLLKTVITTQSRKSLPIKTNNLHLNSFRLLCLDRMFGILAWIPLYFLNKKIPRNKECRILFRFRKKFIKKLKYLKGTLMQIWKSPYMFVFMWK